jgi:hypothetical protein
LAPESAQASASGGNRDARMRERFQSSQWHEGSFVKNGLRFEFSIVRSYDVKRLYYRPEGGLVGDRMVEKRQIEWISTKSDALPIHRVYYSNTDPARAVAYLLMYRSSPVASPYCPQLRSAPLELFSGRHPMTLFLIQTRGPASSLREMEVAEREWLLASWDKYRSACIR